MELTWKSEELPESGLFKRQVTRFTINDIDYRIEAGLYPVMYGWRVRVAVMKEEDGRYAEHYDMDICCGSKLIHIQMIFGMILHRLKKHYINEVRRCGYPVQPGRFFVPTSIKPIINDEYFINWIKDCEGYELFDVTAEELNSFKYRFMNQFLGKDIDGDQMQVSFPVANNE